MNENNSFKSNNSDTIGKTIKNSPVGEESPNLFPERINPEVKVFPSKKTSS